MLPGHPFGPRTFSARAMATVLTVPAALAIAISCNTPPPVTPTVSASPPCPSGRADCDGDPANGCESDLSLPASCGRCGAVCATAEACIAGECRRAHRLQAGAGACAVRGGAVHCWGPPPGPPDEFEARRADTLPRRVLALDDAISVRFNASMSHPVCATRRGGTVACFSETPPALASLTGVRDVATYADDACVVSTSGQLRCGSSSNGLTPVRDVGDAALVVASDDGFFALRASGQVMHVPLEEGAAESLPGIDDAVDVAAAHHSLCVLRRSGKVACSALDYDAAPTLTPARRPLKEVPGLADAVAVDVECAVRKNGEAVQWAAPGSAPRPIPGVKNARQIACGMGFGCYERGDGAVLCWGSRRSGRLGDGAEITRLAPVPVEGIADAKAIVVNDGSCVLRRDGTVWCWGRGGITDERGVPAERVPGAEGASSLSLLYGRACAAGPGKPVRCFPARLPLVEMATFEGLGDVTKAITGWYEPGVALRSNGEVILFDSHARSGVSSPVSVTLAGVRDAVDVAQSGRDVCVLRKSGAVACASLRDVFKKTPPTAPKLVEVKGLRDAVQLSGEQEVCALRRSGATVCIADAPANGKAKPCPGYVTKGWRFRDLAGITRIAEAGLGGCAIDAQRRVYCWSQMGSALRGTGLAEPPAGNLPVQGVSDAVDVSLSSSHACAVLATGRVVCWGSNDGDALGGGEAPASLLPIEVPLGG